MLLRCENTVSLICVSRACIGGLNVCMVSDYPSHDIVIEPYEHTSLRLKEVADDSISTTEKSR